MFFLDKLSCILLFYWVCFISLVTLVKVKVALSTMNSKGDPYRVKPTNY